MKQYEVKNVPRYFEPHVNDCFANAYATVLSYMGNNPNFILTDYLNFMYDEQTEHIGINFFFRATPTVEFSEEELNSSLELAYLPATSMFNKTSPIDEVTDKDKVQINMYIHEDQDIAFTRLKERIDENKPVIVAVDLFYMHFHRAYQREHGLHAIIVTGYDEEKRTLKIIDKYKLSSSDFDGEISMDEMSQSRLSECPLNNPMVGEYKREIRNLWMEIDIDPDFKMNVERIYSIILESCKRMKGQREVLGHECGLNRMEAFRKDLLLKKESFMDRKLDERETYLFKTYYNSAFKSISRSRMRFKVFLEESNLAEKEDLGEVLEQLENALKRWDICANLSLKLGIKKSIKLVDDIVRQLSSIIDIEGEIINKLTDISLTRDLVTVSKNIKDQEM
ncbi:BtrH N-terminal domain-containing protein [Chengkuizengella axinellae]|uniref:BtrH N-terminal domain-containing protein n=1 Tax=Chengkuizengella axinellae TaxID=3064388 RepID=A0ABT9IZ47_9BACL|nr:BtrH N-terminal domain-containing protein [Chengkuizengella sp. 2205SS18-9]MDP5274593.1 BtrH N-terminal domain-containing protein [Chengkuizengella sp. 2205SS18-9]